MKIPKVSVLMPVYNGEKYLVEAVESILNQTFKDFELVIVDDGSTDKSLEILNTFTDSRIKIFRRPHWGIIKTLNIGLSKCQGKYIARMDCDDVAISTRLQKQYEFMESHQNIDVCGAFVRYFTRIPGFGQTYGVKGSAEEIKANLIFENVVQHPTVFIKREIFKQKYPSDFPHAEDYGLWVNILQKTTFFVYPEVLLNYRLHSLQVGQIYNGTQTTSVFKVHRILLKKLIPSISKEELSLHDDLCFGRYKNAIDFVNDVETWLLKLYDANKVSKIFDQKALGQVLSDRWLSICLMESVLGNDIWTNYQKSSLTKLGKQNFKRLRQLWLESKFLPKLRPWVASIKKNPIIKKILLG